MNEINKKGLSTTLLCCLIWGLLPLYWALLNQVSSFSVLSHRIIWSGFWMLVLIIVTGRQQLRIDIQHLRAHLSQFGLLLLAAVLISINWFTYIWAVTNQHVLDTSLGYYINPLLNVLLGILIYKESLLWPQKLSIAIAILGVAIMTVQLGTLPIVSIVLAVSLASTALLRNDSPSSILEHRLRSMARHTGGIVVSNGYRHHLVDLYRKPNADRSPPHRCRPYHIDSAHPLFIRCPPIATKYTRLFTIPVPYHGLLLGHLLLW